MATNYQLKFEEITTNSASPAKYLTKETETKIHNFDPSKRLRELNQKRGKFALGSLGFKLAA